jgi:hypothetical protein
LKHRRRRIWDRRLGPERVANFASRCLLRSGKFAEQLAGRGHVRGVRRLRGRKSAQLNVLPALPNACAPQARFAAEADALVPRGVVTGTASVRVVLRQSRAPQVVPTIVGDIPVAVVDRRPPPPAGHVEPRQLVLAVRASRDPDEPSTMLPIYRSGQMADADSIVVAPAPTKFAGFGMVMQQRAQPRARQTRTFSHGGLANEKGPQSGPRGDLWGRMRLAWAARLSASRRRKPRTHAGTLHFGRSQIREAASNGVRQFGAEAAVALGIIRRKSKVGCAERS